MISDNMRKMGKHEGVTCYVYYGDSIENNRWSYVLPSFMT